MELAFETKSLRDICEREERAQRELGKKIARRLRSRLADLAAAAHGLDIPAGRPRRIRVKGQPCISVELADGAHIVFCANHDKIPVVESRRIDWSKVDRIKILKIGADHE